MPTTRSFRTCEHEVEAQVRIQTPVATVETAIEKSGLGPDEKAALWLASWSLVGLEADHQPVDGPALLG